MQRRLEVVAELADGFEPKIERKVQRIERTAQRVVGLADHVLRLGEQFGGGGVAGVAGGLLRQLAVGDVVLEDLVDDVDVGHRRVRVFAGQSDVRQVRATLDEHLVGLHPIS